MKILTAFLMALFTSCVGNKLEEKQQTLELTYLSWACDCANWATEYDINNYEDDALAERSIFIEPAFRTMVLPDTLGWSGDIIRFTGQFYEEKGFPQDYESAEYPDKARVFRYVNFEVVKSNYADFQRSMTD